MTTENTQEQEQVQQADDKVELLPTKFHPKARQRFILKFDGVDSYLVKNIDLPEFLIVGNSIQPSKEIVLYLHCPGTPSTEIQIMNTVKKQVSGTTLDPAKICFLDPVGTIVSEYVFYNPKIVSFKISDLSYEASENLEMIVKISYDAFVVPR